MSPHPSSEGTDSLPTREVEGMDASRDLSPAASGVVLTEAAAEALVQAAQRAKDVVTLKINAKISAAEAAIKAEHDSELREATAALVAARTALTEAKDRTADHPWTGRRVFRMQRVGRYWEKLPPKRVDGVVETYRSTSALPANTASYGRPGIGQPIVRLLTKDGSPGVRFERMTSHSGWALAHADTSSQSDPPREASEPNPTGPTS